MSSRKHRGNSTCGDILPVHAQMCINHNEQLAYAGGFSAHFLLSVSLMPPQPDTQPEVEAKQMKRQRGDVRCATEEQEPRGQIGVEKRDEGSPLQ